MDRQLAFRRRGCLFLPRIRSRPSRHPCVTPLCLPAVSVDQAVQLQHLGICSQVHPANGLQYGAKLFQERDAPVCDGQHAGERGDWDAVCEKSALSVLCIPWMGDSIPIVEIRYRPNLYSGESPFAGVGLADVPEHHWKLDKRSDTPGCGSCVYLVCRDKQAARKCQEERSEDAF